MVHEEDSRPFMIDRKTTQVRRFLFTISIFFVALTALSLYINLSKVRAQYAELALHIGRSHFQTMTMARRWNAEHMGVYVPVHDNIQPNPYLEDPLRDLTTTAGLKLTKINPAYMTRLTSEILEQEEGVHLHITSLNPINPRNAPDEWERQVLTAFGNGEREQHQIIDSEHPPVFRYMAPLKTETSCLPCHQKHGYSVGDVRGGISVTFSYEPFLRVMSAQNRQIISTHFFFLAISLTVIVVLGRKLVAGIGQLEESLLRIRTLEGILPICSRCKKMRSEHGDPRDEKSWVPVEQYISQRTEAAFSHGICPSCAAELYPDVDLSRKDH